MGADIQIAAFSFGKVQEMVKREGGQKVLLDVYVARNTVYQSVWFNNLGWRYKVTNGMVARAQDGGFNTETGKYMDRVYMPEGWRQGEPQTRFKTESELSTEERERLWNLPPRAPGSQVAIL